MTAPSSLPRVVFMKSTWHTFFRDPVRFGELEALIWERPILLPEPLLRELVCEFAQWMVPGEPVDQMMLYSEVVHISPQVTRLLRALPTVMPDIERVAVATAQAHDALLILDVRNELFMIDPWLRESAGLPESGTAWETFKLHHLYLRAVSFDSP